MIGITQEPHKCAFLIAGSPPTHAADISITCVLMSVATPR